MSTKENSGEVAVEKVTENDKPNADAKCEIKGIKRAAEVSPYSVYTIFFLSLFFHAILLYSVEYCIIHSTSTYIERDDHVRCTRSRACRIQRSLRCVYIYLSVTACQTRFPPGCLLQERTSAPAGGGGVRASCDSIFSRRWRPLLARTSCSRVFILASRSFYLMLSSSFSTVDTSKVDNRKDREKKHNTELALCVRSVGEKMARRAP